MFFFVSEYSRGDLKETCAASGEDVTGNGSQRLSLKNFFQWVTGNAHVPAEPQRNIFTIDSEHDCNSCYGKHGTCYPLVKACGGCSHIYHMPPRNIKPLCDEPKHCTRVWLQIQQVINFYSTCFKVFFVLKLNSLVMGPTLWLYF